MAVLKIRFRLCFLFIAVLLLVTSVLSFEWTGCVTNEQCMALGRSLVGAAGTEGAGAPITPADAPFYYYQQMRDDGKCVIGFCATPCTDDNDCYHYAAHRSWVYTNSADPIFDMRCDPDYGACVFKCGLADCDDTEIIYDPSYQYELGTRYCSVPEFDDIDYEYSPMSYFCDFNEWRTSCYDDNDCKPISIPLKGSNRFEAFLDNEAFYSCKDRECVFCGANQGCVTVGASYRGFDEDRDGYCGRMPEEFGDLYGAPNGCNPGEDCDDNSNLCTTDCNANIDSSHDEAEDLFDCRDWCVDKDGDGWCRDSSARFVNSTFPIDYLSKVYPYGWQLKPIINDDYYRASTRTRLESFVDEFQAASSDAAKFNVQKKYKNLTLFDCNDDNRAINWGVSENTAARCVNEIDDDCNGLIDFDDPKCEEFYNYVIDKDGDGYNPENEGGDDCDDNNKSIHPGAIEVIDGVDNNCNGLIDEVISDEDGDGYVSVAVGSERLGDQCPAESLEYTGALRDAYGCFDVPGWDYDRSATEAYVVEELTSPTSFYGKKVLKIVNGAVSQRVEINSSQEHVVSFYYKVESGSLDFKMNAFGQTEDILPVVTFTNNEWTRYTAVIEPFGDLMENVFIVFSVPAQSSVLIDGVMLEENSEATVFRDFVKEKGCCPEDFCWTGSDCVHDKLYMDNISKPPIGTEFAGDLPLQADGYRCINGTWKFSRFKWDPVLKEGGYCPEDSQCFIGGKGEDPNIIPIEKVCIDSGRFDTLRVGDSVESFYCFNGEWTTRTKAIALKLLNLTSENDEFTLFCDSYLRSANSLNTKEFRGLDFDIDDLFSFNVGVNEFCVLNWHPDGDDSKIVVGVSLDNEINDIENAAGTAGAEKYSFIELIKNDITYCDAVIEAGGIEFQDCNPDTEIADVWYSPELRSVIFTKSGKKVELLGPETFIDKAISALRNLLERLGFVDEIQATDTSFVESAHFDKIYMSQDKINTGADRVIKGLIETRYFDGVLKTRMDVEYLNYAVDVCDLIIDESGRIKDYVYGEESNLPIGCVLEIQNLDEWKYSVFVDEFKFKSLDITDNIWNDMTAKVRSQANEFTQVPLNVQSIQKSVVPAQGLVPGTKITFNLSALPESLKFVTFDFGDGNSASFDKYEIDKSLNRDELIATHKYSKPGIYLPKAYLMNDLYNIGVIDFRNLQIDNFAMELLLPDSLSDVSSGDEFSVRVYNGSLPINVYWYVGDDTEYQATGTMPVGGPRNIGKNLNLPKGLGNVTIVAKDDNQVEIERLFRIYVK